MSLIANEIGVADRCRYVTVDFDPSSHMYSHTQRNIGLIGNNKAFTNDEQC